uniref:Bravo_FIGEY domain-containing protein n=1 Tax=Taenia asiatica TaxID=60517 RepID=A0A0R3VWE4_TAEAS
LRDFEARLEEASVKSPGNYGSPSKFWDRKPDVDYRKVNSGNNVEATGDLPEEERRLDAKNMTFGRVEGIGGDLALHVRYTGAEAPRPHGVRVSVNWANERLTTDPMPNSVNDLRLTHRMSKEGNLMLEVLVCNDVFSQRIPLHFNYFRCIISALINALIDELNIPGYGREHKCFTTDDSIRFESVFKGGAIDATHIVIREVDKGITTIEQTYAPPSIVYKMITGECKVTANISNTINFYTAAKTVCIQGKVRGYACRFKLQTSIPGSRGKLDSHLLDSPTEPAFVLTWATADAESASTTRRLTYTDQKVTHPVIGRTTAGLNVTVASAICYPPRITLDSPNIANPNAPVRIKAEDRLAVVARSNGTVCPHFEPMVYKWEISELDYANVPHYMLEPGLFEAYLKGMMGGVEVCSAVSAFIAVAELTPVIRLEKNGEEMISVSEDITAKYSFNPNFSNAKPEESLEDWQLTCTRCAYEYDSAVTFCELPMIDGRKLGELCIDRSLLNCTEVYRFQAWASDGQNNGVRILQVTFVPAEVPSLLIAMVRPQLGLVGYLEGITSTMDKIYADGTTGPLAMEEMNKAPKDKGACVTFGGRGPDDIGESQFPPSLAEFGSKTLIISSNFLTSWDAGFKLLPVLGGCRVDSTGEITKDTNVCISCDGMDSNKRPVLYRFQKKINEKLFTFGTSSKPKYCGQVPYVTGDFELCVGVTDNMGSINERCFVSLYFKTETSDDVYAKLEGIFNATDHVLSGALTTSDPSNISATLQSLSRLVKGGTKMATKGICSAKSSITLVISERVNRMFHEYSTKF